MHPDRPKLADLIAEELRRAIKERRWDEWLPQERALAAELKVSRATLRQAMAAVRAEGLFEVVPRRGTRIASNGRPGSATRAKSGERVVNLLLPGSADSIRPTVVQWVDELRALLAAKRWQLRTIEAKACYARSPERALELQFARTPAGCWLVRLSTLPMQRWFQRCGTPVVIAGSCHRGIDLTFVDIDHRAVCRHATGAILAAGHRRIMLLVDEDGKAGDLESEQGFVEAARPGTDREIRATVARHDGTVRGVITQVERALRSATPPTAILTTQAVFCLTLWSYLGSREVHIPARISLVTQVGAPYLAYLVPEPTSYRINQRKYAQTIMRALSEAVAPDPRKREHLILPNFVGGGSLAAPAPEAEGRL